MIGPFNGALDKLQAAKDELDTHVGGPEKWSSVYRPGRRYVDFEHVAKLRNAATALLAQLGTS